MLGEAVLEELARDAPIQPYLVKAAWPSLSTESKLQLIQAMQRVPSPSTPDWLIDLALSDDATIVRIWAARYAYFKTRQPLGVPAFGAPPTEQDMARRECAARDVEPLVRAKVDAPSMFLDFEELSSLPQLERLWAIRTMDRPDLACFIDWLEKAMAADLPEHELCECVREFFALPQLKEELSKPEASQDPYGAIRIRDAMVKGWELLKKAPLVLQNTLVFRLPLRLGDHTEVTAERLATLPAQALMSLFYLSPADSTKELEKLKSRVLSNPEEFDDKVVKTLQREQEDYLSVPTLDEVRRCRILQRSDPAKAALEVLVTVLERFDALEQRLDDIENAQRMKKGFWS